MHLGLHIHDRPVLQIRDLASAAEAAGFSHAFFPELSVTTPGPATGRDPLVASSVALDCTSSLRVGTAIIATAFHAPRHLALAAATLTEQSGGRFILGVGVAHPEFAKQIGMAFPSRILSHARDACVALRQFSAGGTAFGSGFPVWLAALGSGMVQTAVEAADGVILNWVTPGETARVSSSAAHRQPGWTVAAMVRVGHRSDLLADAERYRSMFGNYASHFDRQGLRTASDVVEATCLAVDDEVRWSSLLDEYAASGVDILILNPSRLRTDEISSLLPALVKAGGR